MKLMHGPAERGAGYCLNPSCSDWYKAIFLWNHGAQFRCPRCHQYGWKEVEEGFTLLDDNLDFYQVRVEFNYEPRSNDYKGLAVITDESMPKDGNVYTFKSCLIRTEKRALQVAENLLGCLLRADFTIFEKQYIPRDQQYIVDFDKPLEEVQGNLHSIGEILEQSRLSIRNA